MSGAARLPGLYFGVIESARGESAMASIGDTFVGLISDALKAEEGELAQLCLNCSDPSLVSVRQFDEAWIKYLVAKAAMRQGGFRVEFETQHVDVHIYQQKKFLGCAELKGPYPFKQTFDRGIFDRIVEDFRKQGERSQGERSEVAPEFLVVVLLCGNQSDVEGWISDRLLLAVNTQLPHLRVERLASQPIPLNRRNGIEEVLCVACFRVVKLASATAN